MFEPIINHYLDTGAIQEPEAHGLRCLNDFLVSETDYTKSRLTEVIQLINHSNAVKSSLGLYPVLEFTWGMDSYELSLIGDTLYQKIDELKIVRHDEPEKLRYEINKIQQSVKIDDASSPASLHCYSSSVMNHAAMFYTWLASIWQDIDGYQCGLKVCTRQNNSDAGFSLNDFLVAEISAYIGKGIGGEVSHPIKSHFHRKLSVVELFMRTSQANYPCNSYSNYWRYFEKGDEFLEFVTYEFATGTRNGKLSDQIAPVVENVVQHDGPISAQLKIAEYTELAIKEGWEEKHRPKGLPHRMHRSAFDFSYWTGVNWYNGKKEEANRLKIKDILAFELRHNIRLPEALAQYLRLFNGRQANKHLMNFPIDDNNLVRVKRFHTLIEISEMATTLLKLYPQFLWIGILEDDRPLGVCVDSDDQNTFGKVVIDNNMQMQVCEYSFEVFSRYAQD